MDPQPGIIAFDRDPVPVLVLGACEFLADGCRARQFDGVAVVFIELVGARNGFWVPVSTWSVLFLLFPLFPVNKERGVLITKYRSTPRFFGLVILDVVQRERRHPPRRVFHQIESDFPLQQACFCLGWDPRLCIDGQEERSRVDQMSVSFLGVSKAAVAPKRSGAKTDAHIKKKSNLGCLPNLGPFNAALAAT